MVLGTGKKALESQVTALEKVHPGLAAGVVKFSNPMAHTITAGADYMLVPSRFEPCGLIQLHAMQVRGRPGGGGSGWAVGVVVSDGWGARKVVCVCVSVCVRGWVCVKQAPPPTAAPQHLTPPLSPVPKTVRHRAPSGVHGWAG